MRPLPVVAVTVMAALHLRVPGRLMSPLSLPVPMLMLRWMHVTGLLMNPRAMPLAILMPGWMRVPEPQVNPWAKPLAMVVARRMHTPGPLMTQPDVPLALMAPGLVMPSPVVAIDDEGTIVEGPSSRGEADRVPPIMLMVDRRSDQSADDGTHERAFPRPSGICLSGCRRHGRAEHDGGCERDSPDEPLFPALHHLHPPFSTGSLRQGARSD